MDSMLQSRISGSDLIPLLNYKTATPANIFNMNTVFFYTNINNFFFLANKCRYINADASRKKQK